MQLELPRRVSSCCLMKNHQQAICKRKDNTTQRGGYAIMCWFSFGGFFCCFVVFFVCCCCFQILFLVSSILLPSSSFLFARTSAQERWFALIDASLLYFKSRRETKSLGTINLVECFPRESPIQGLRRKATYHIHNANVEAGESFGTKKIDFLRSEHSQFCVVGFQWACWCRSQ